jgi:hypothetical protein
MDALRRSEQRVQGGQRLHRRRGVRLSSVMWFVGWMITSARCKRLRYALVASCGLAAGVTWCFPQQPVATVSFFYMKESNPQIGGRPADRRTTYLASDGVMQKSVLRGDTVQAFLSTNANVSALLNKISATFSGAPTPESSDNAAQPKPPQRMIESFPASLEVRFVDHSGAQYFWIGRTNDAPHWLQETIVCVTSELRHLVPAAVREAAFCCAAPLGDPAVQQYRKDAILVDVTEQHLKQNALLTRCLAFPCRFFAIQQGEYPFSPFRTVFQPGRDAMNFWYRTNGVQVRVYD